MQSGKLRPRLVPALLVKNMAETLTFYQRWQLDQQISATGTAPSLPVLLGWTREPSSDVYILELCRGAQRPGQGHPDGPDDPDGVCPRAEIACSRREAFSRVGRGDRLDRQGRQDPGRKCQIGAIRGDLTTAGIARTRQGRQGRQDSAPLWHPAPVAGSGHRRETSS